MGSKSKSQRPGKRKQICDGMKLHLREFVIRGVTHRLITLRPHSDVAFSTNYFHETWHILSDRHGAQLLARLMWGLSYQRKPNTVVMIHGEHIKPTPFGAERSNPILLMLDDHACKDAKSLRSLHRKLGTLGTSHRTVRWKTFGLDLALAKRAEQDPNDWSREAVDTDWMWYRDNERLWKNEEMFRRGGFVCYSAPPQIMRAQSLAVATMDPSGCGMDYFFIAERNASRWPDGEVQIFSDYDERRSAAAEARRNVLSERPTFADEQGLYEAVACERDRLLEQRRENHRVRLADRSVGEARDTTRGLGNCKYRNLPRLSRR